MSDVEVEGSAKTQWEQVIEAVSALGGRATRHDVWEYLKKSQSDISFSSITANLLSASVNSPARTSHHTGKIPRRTDTGNRYDRLYKVGVGEGTYFVPYNPAVHGVWEIFPDSAATSSHKNSIRLVEHGAFNADAAIAYLKQRYPSTYSGTSHIAAFRTPAGRQLALDPKIKKGARVFVDARPPGMEEDRIREYPPGETRNHHLDQHAPAMGKGETAFLILLASLQELEGLCDWYEGVASSPIESSIKVEGKSESMTGPINRILYGPPGTGKTYHTVNEALELLDPDFKQAHEDDRAALKARFDELAAAQRIRFVTFHQSFSYEDFVEGVRADSEGGELQYRVEPGVFRRICEDAGGSAQVASDIGVREDARIWKISIDSTGSFSPTRDYCLGNGEARIGWHDVGDLRNERLGDVPAYAALGSNDRSTLHAFSREIEPGDVLLCIRSENEVLAVGVVQGEYEYEPRPPANVRQDYPNVLPVRWLATDLALDIRPINDGRKFTVKAVYEMSRFGWTELAEYMESEGVVLQGQAPSLRSRAVPHVLIIDEINRGNVSRIFGELITLIEPSKRKGASEALEVVLPYSRKRFSVPDNVHIIGTMNTADRSLAGLDVALRRRFEFREMMPDTGALAGVIVAGIQVDRMLEAMNQRIEVLLGRDFMIGHAYFMGLKGSAGLDDLARIFRRQVLPLLQEYFFEDWEKIALVLNDHRKATADRFVRERAAGLDALFGAEMDVPRGGSLWEVNNGAFARAEAYRGIIEVASAPA